MSTGSIAEALHSSAVRLLRYLRGSDADAGLTGPQASALSVLVFGGETTLGSLAGQEQVAAPTMSRLVRDMEASGLVQRRANEADGRSVLISATRRGRSLLDEAKGRRLARLERSLSELTDDERETLARAAGLIGKLTETGPDNEGRRESLSPRPRRP